MNNFHKRSKPSLVNFFLLGGTITLTTWLAIDSFSNYAWGQITSDGTVNSQVISPSSGNFLINGGTTRGSNLFHSFSEFSIPSKGSASFNNLQPIQNIITRVTGGAISNIDGVIGANGTANVFLINPNGIVFGPNAQLKIGGSFVASTASSLNFADGTKFSANASQTTPLLTVSAPLGLQYGNNPGSIQVKDSTLQVNNGQTLALVGGKVQLDNAVLEAPGGRIELGGLAGKGIVGLNFDGNNLRLSFPNGVAFSDVFLTNNTEVNVLANGSGSIAVNAQNLTLTEESRLLAGIDSGLGSSDSIPGDIEIQAKEAINLTNGLIHNVVLAGGKGKGGNVKITTGQLFVLGGAELVAATLGLGDGGNIIINASEKVQVTGTTPDGQFISGVGTTTQGRGAAGNLEITTKELLVSGGAQIGTGTVGLGNGGNLIIKASEKVEIVGTTPNILRGSSGLYTQTEPQAQGKAGNLEITTKQLLILEGGQISASTFGAGDGGNLIVNASDSVQIIGTSSVYGPKGQSPSGLFTDSQGTGKAGNLVLTTGNLLVAGGALINASTTKSGDGGNLIINASDSVQVIGVSASGDSSSLTAATFGTGKAGNLVITTRQLKVLDGAEIGANTVKSGDGGNLIVNASDSVQVTGTTPNGQYSSSLNANTEGIGQGGNLEINTRQLLVSDGGQIDSGTRSSGKGGKLTVKASEKVQVIGTAPNDQFPSGLFTSSNGTGDAGNLVIDTKELIIQDRAVVAVSSQKKANAGNLNITANSIRLDNQGQITAETASGQGGNINFKVQDLLLMRNGSKISTTAGTAKAGGDGGNIGIDSLFIVAVPKENSDITANAYTGKGGNVNITTQAIYGLELRPRLTGFSDITASSEFGINGTVQINTSGIDPSRGLNNLPVEPVTLEVAEGCQGESKPGAISFVNTGRGGLLPNPYESLSSSNLWEDVASPTPATANSTTAHQTIAEAQSWLVNDKGEVVLVAASPVTRSKVRCRLR